jgi:hypothetical protein
VENFTSPIVRPEHYRRIMASIHVSEHARGGLIFRVEERCEQMCRRGTVNELSSIAILSSCRHWPGRKRPLNSSLANRVRPSPGTCPLSATRTTAFPSPSLSDTAPSSLNRFSARLSAADPKLCFAWISGGGLRTLEPQPFGLYTRNLRRIRCEVPVRTACAFFVVARSLKKRA